MLGDTVNVAARLKARARLGMVYAGPETRAEAGDGFEWRTHGSFLPKGKTVEVPLLELVGSHARSSGLGPGTEVESTLPWIGRDAELARLESHIEALAAGRGGALLVTGVQGAGKSRLVATAAARPSADKVEWIHARPDSGSSSPLRLVAALLRAWRADGESSLADAVETGRLGAAATPRAAEFLSVKARTRPVAIVLEDLQDAGPAATAAVAALADALRAEPVLWIAVLRTDAAQSSVDLRQLFGGAEEIALEALSPEASARLVEAAAGGGLDAAARDLVLAHGQGNPGRLLLGAFLEPALRAEQEHQAARVEDAERKRATILFADISGFTALTERAGAEHSYAVVVRCLRLLDTVAREWGGTVEKYLGDCVMALFGVHEAIEDAPRAAVNAALDMRHRVRLLAAELGIDLDVHSGINTGLGIAGDVAGALVREFAVMGEAVNVADELKDLSPAGSIWVGVEVQRATRDAFEYRALDPISLGRGAPLVAFEVASLQPQRHRAQRRLISRIVGRDRELALLQAALERLRGGHGGVVSVIAEAGLGKSRLIAEVAASEPAREIAWREGRSIAVGRHASFHPIADLCRSWIGAQDDDDDAKLLERLDATIRRLVPDEVEELLPPMASLLGLRLDPERQARLDALQGDALEKLILRSVTQLLRGGSALRPLVVVMDDLHWADQSSLGLLESLLRLCEEHPILFLNLFRPACENTSERIRTLARERHADRYLEIELEPLDDSAARSLLNNLFRQGDIPHATRELIEQKARGNPFFIEEVVRALVDEGAVEVHDGRFRATERIHEFTIPGTIQEVVMARVDALPLHRRQMLQTASVIGDHFHLDVLAHVLDGPGVRDAIDALADAEFLVPSDRLPGEEWAFKHPLLQEIIYEGLLHARREELHRRVGEGIEAKLSPELPAYEGMLAYHFGRARDFERAEAYLFAAGDRAARAAASSEALHFFREASELYLELHADGGDPAKRATLESRIASALYYRGRFVEAIDHFNAALTLLGDRVVRSGIRVGVQFAINLVVVLLRLYGPRLRRRLPAATDREREIMTLRYARAEATVTAAPTRHLFDSMDTIALLERMDPRTVPGSGRLYAGAAALFAFAGLSFDVSRRFGAKARALVHPEDTDECLYQLAMDFTCRLLEGDWARAEEIDAERIEESVRNGQLWGPTTYLGLLGEMRLHQGDFDAARDCIERIDRMWDLFQYDLAKTNHYYLLTLLPLAQDDYARAIEAANAYYDENPEDLLHILALSMRAKAETLSGDLDVAATSLTLAADLMTASGPVAPFHAAAYQRSRLLLDVALLEQAVAGSGRERRDALRRARRSVRAAARGAAKVAWHRPEVFRLEARMHELRGDLRAAIRVLERAIGEGERLGMRSECRRIYAAAVRILAQKGPGLRFAGLDSDECRRRAQNSL